MAPSPQSAAKRGGLPTSLAVIFARNLRRLRFQRGLTLERLAEHADINLLALTQLEDGKGEPSLASAWKIAAALDVPFASLIAGQAPRGAVLLRKDKANQFVSESRGLTSRALFAPEDAQRTEFYELRLAPHHRENSEPHALGTSEILHVTQGALEVTVGREPPYLVNKGDTIVFPADLPHSYRNLTDLPALLYLVMTYAQSITNPVGAAAAG